MARIRSLDFLLGLQGIAILRNWLRGPAVTDPRLDEMARLLAARDHPANALELSDFDVVEGYAAWVSTYDAPGNALVAAEEPAVRELIGAVQPGGRALDAACGTGRHTRYLASWGFDVVGVDRSPQMLDKAKAAIPEGTFCLGDISCLPMKSCIFDVSVCALALDHVPTLEGPIRELARTLRPAGCAIVSMLHPINLLLGGSAFFQDSAGRFGNVRSFYHGVEEFVSAFSAAGLEILKCVEPVWSEREVAMMNGYARMPEAISSALCGTPLALIWQARKSL